MPIPLRVLNVEDSEDDALQLVRYLRKAGYDVTFERVDTPKALQDALEGDRWDVVVADYVLPSFSAPAAVALMKEHHADLPVVIVSGAMLDDVMAMEALRSGSQDYLAKTYLSRLIPAIGLAAGVLPEADRPAAHLALCQEYLNLPEPVPAKAVYHGEQALRGAEALGRTDVYAHALLEVGRSSLHMGWAEEAVAVLERFAEVEEGLGHEAALLKGEVLLQMGLAREAMGDRTGAIRSLKAAAAWFREQQVTAKEAEVAGCLLGMEGPDAIEPPEVDRFSGLLGRGEYDLMSGDPAAAVRKALEALEEAEGNSLRCYLCYNLLMRCARVQGHPKDALNFALSARMMALEAGQYAYAFKAWQAFSELHRDLGRQGEELLAELVRDYRRLGVDVSRFMPDSM